MAILSSGYGSITEMVDAHHWTIDSVMDLTLFDVRLLACDPTKLRERAHSLALSEEGRKREQFLRDQMR